VTPIGLDVVGPHDKGAKQVSESPTVAQVGALFDLERETKTKMRFKERVDEGVSEVVGTLYVSKSVLESMGNPSSLHMTLEVME
jgi:hypothetical protein